MSGNPPGSHQPSDKDAILSTPHGPSQHVMLTVNKYTGRYTDWHGALIEETSAFRSDVELFYDMHVLLWDGDIGQTLNARDDAYASDVSYASSTVPEIEIENRFAFEGGYDATLTQNVVTSVNDCALLIDNHASFDHPHEHTLYTLLDLGIHGHSHDDPHAVQVAEIQKHDDTDVLVASDTIRYMAVTQHWPDEDRRGFDGHRIGHNDVLTGPDKAAWTDVYIEDDGYIDDNTNNTGDLDAVVGLYTADATDVEWETAIGFGETAAAAVDNALSVRDRGYEAEREDFAAAWEDWHADRAGCPVEDERVSDCYEKSLTSLKCAQDESGGVIAGAFKPQEMTYKFIWPRDQVIVTQALCAAGAYKGAREALEWFADVQITESHTDDRGIERKGSWYQNYYATGEPHWTALQLDQVGGPIYAHWLVWKETGDDGVLHEFYDTSRLAAEFLLRYDRDGFPGPHQDPWEENWGLSTEGTASGIAGLRAFAEMAEERGDATLAADCRSLADTWASNLADRCYVENSPYGDHYITAAEPEGHRHPPADWRPDAAAFMATWPWNVVPADDDTMLSTIEATGHPDWGASQSPCLGRYPGDKYTPTGTAEDGGWPLCEAYADLVRWQAGTDPDAVRDHVFEDAAEWTTAAGLLPERVDGHGHVRWNSNLQWSQAMYVLLTESLARGEPYGLAPGN